MKSVWGPKETKANKMGVKIYKMKMERLVEWMIVQKILREYSLPHKTIKHENKNNLEGHFSNL